MDTEKTHENSLAGVCAAGMAVAAGLIRVLPHPFNFTPVGALGLFGGSRLPLAWAAVLPLAVMAVSDLLLLALHPGYRPFNPWVYGCFLLTVIWGRLLLRNAGAGRIAAVSVLVSVQFFLVTNLGVWLASSVDAATLPEGTTVVWKEIPGLPAPVPTAYARTPAGLLACYVVALPFAGTNAPPLGWFGNQLVGDLFYSAVLFGAYAWLVSRVPALRRTELAAPRVP